MELVFIGITFLLFLLMKAAGRSTEPMADAAIAQHNPAGCAASLIPIILFGCASIVMVFVALAEINESGAGVEMLRKLATGG